MTLLVLFLAIAVKNDHTALRNGCDPAAETVAMVPAGAPVTIRFSLAGEEKPCFKVAVELDGKKMEGYLPASEIDGLDQFENERRDAAIVGSTADVKEMMNALPSIAPKSAAAAQASRMIESSQPSKALELLQQQLSHSRDPNLFALAGFAAWRADQAKLALEYWKTSLDLQPNAGLQQIYRRVERETSGDQSTEKLVGMRVALRYDRATVPSETARQMLSTLDQEFTRVSAELGCSAEERIVAIVQSPEAYRKTVDVAEWNAGQFDGRIRVPVSGKMDEAVRRVFAHETVHACLAMLGRWPPWFHEGLAQKLSGDTVTAAMRSKIAAETELKKLPRLENLGQDWSRLDTEHARLAYGESLEAIELFYENYAQFGIANLLRNPDRLAAITAELDRRLGL